MIRVTIVIRVNIGMRVIARRIAVLAATAATAAAAAGTFLAEGLRALGGGGYVVPAGTLALVVACAAGLCVGCCCGLGWGLLLGSASPHFVTRLARAGSALAAASVQEATPSAARGPAPRPVQRRPTFLQDEL